MIEKDSDDAWPESFSKIKDIPLAGATGCGCTDSYKAQRCPQKNSVLSRNPGGSLGGVAPIFFGADGL